VAAAVAILVGVVGGIGRTGSLFIPALVALVVGSVMLWRAKPR
jgi:SNF family Na+-dependent transporter